MKNKKSNVWRFMIWFAVIIFVAGVSFGILFAKGWYLALLLPVFSIGLGWIGLPAFIGRTLQNLKVEYKTNDISKLIEELRKR